ncbi:NAD(P)-binding protein [Spongiactinospora sp. TRM90649]|uniref:NAD(P)-binding protein n=1 Tax=Spongiactinospora sp. TRM90649 TaxID=3031114 RepID=UPI0023F9E006|nr:NAD(P)-binding protein [Spongiactinospora sp. TRM90649]MDF5758102.1 NAD(P)-binding protein [Spongiactinospora sp. TRM90649]
MPTVAIIGAGFGGQCTEIRWRAAGIASFTVFEKADRIGGERRGNAHSGSGCDIPFHLHSYFFEKYSTRTRRHYAAGIPTGNVVPGHAKDLRRG